MLWRKDIPDLAKLSAADGHTALVATSSGKGTGEVDDLGAVTTMALEAMAAWSVPVLFSPWYQRSWWTSARNTVR